MATSNYQFFTLLSVVVFAISGARGIVRLWVILYALVGTQMAWTPRPFVGAPSLPFELFRSLGEILGFWMVR